MKIINLHKLSELESELNERSLNILTDVIYRYLETSENFINDTSSYGNILEHYGLLLNTDKEERKKTVSPHKFGG